MGDRGGRKRDWKRESLTQCQAEETWTNLSVTYGSSKHALKASSSTFLGFSSSGYFEADILIQGFIRFSLSLSLSLFSLPNQPSTNSVYNTTQSFSHLSSQSCMALTKTQSLHEPLCFLLALLSTQFRHSHCCCRSHFHLCTLVEMPMTLRSQVAEGSGNNGPQQDRVSKLRVESRGQRQRPLSDMYKLRRGFQAFQARFSLHPKTMHCFAFHFDFPRIIFSSRGSNDKLASRFL